MERTDMPINLQDFSLELDISENGLSIIIDHYNGDAGQITIPGNCNGLPIKKIDNFAFHGNKKIRKIIIEKGVTSLGFNTFSDCTELIEIDLPDSLLEIDSSAFSGCRKLASIRFPESLLKIGHYAFENCKELTDIFIPKEVLICHVMTD